MLLPNFKISFNQTLKKDVLLKLFTIKSGDATSIKAAGLLRLAYDSYLKESESWRAQAEFPVVSLFTFFFQFVDYRNFSKSFYLIQNFLQKISFIQKDFF